MGTFKTKAKVKNNYKVQVKDVPFDDGQEVEIIISIKNENDDCEKIQTSLKGSVLKYDNPFDSAISYNDWELLK